MRFINLYLENWGPHEQLDIEFGSSLQIEGRNGTGKSSILEALRFIFAESARGYSKRIKNGSRMAQTILSFEHDGQEYVVEKKIYLEKASQAQLTIDGFAVADNPSSVYLRLQQTIPEEILDRLIYIPQGGLTSILDRLTGREGKIELDTLFGLDRLEHVWQMSGEELKNEKTKLELLSGQLESFDKDAQQSLENQILEYGGKSTIIEKTCKDLNEKMGFISKELVKIISELKGYEDKRKEFENLKTKVNELLVRRTQQKTHLENLSEKKQEKEKLHKQLCEINAQIEKTKHMGKIKSLLDEQKAISAKKPKKEDLEQMKEESLKIEKALHDVPKAEKEFVDISDGIEKLRQLDASFDAEKNHQIKHLESLSSLEKETVCTRCGQKLDPNTIGEETQKTKKRVEELQTAKKQSESELRKLKEIEKAITQRLTELRQMAQDLKKYKGLLEESRLKQIELEKAENVILEELSKNGYADQDISDVQAIADEHNMLCGKREILKNRQEKLSNIEQEKKQIEESINELDALMQATKKQIDGMNLDDKKEKSLTDEKNKLVNENIEANTRLDGLANEQNMIKKLVLEKKHQLTQLKDLKEQKEKTQRSHDLLLSARDVFHRDKGLVRYLRHTYLIRLNTLLAGHFKRFNQNPRYIDVSFDKDYNIHFETTYGNVDSGQVSGGERVQLALALRLALMDLMSPIRLMILDEPFGSLDESHRELLADALSNISRQGQLIIVTHIHVENLMLENRLDLGGY